MKGEDGFLLIEVLVAFMMASLALAVLYGALTDNTRQIYESELREVTLAYALSHLAAVGVSAPAEAAQGTYPNGTTWTLQVVPLRGKVPDEVPRPRTVYLKLLLDVFDRRKRHLINLKTYQLQGNDHLRELQ